MEAVWSASARGQQPREKTSRQAFQQHRIALRAAKAEAKALARQQGVEHSFDELLTEEGISLGPPPFSMAQVSSLLGHMPGEQPAEKISPSRLALLQAYDACHERFGGFDEPCMLQRLWPQDTFDEDVRSSATVHIYRAYTGDTTSRFEDLVEEASAIAWRRDAHPTESIPFLYSAWQVQPPTSAAEYARWLREPPLSVGDRDVLIAPSIATGDWTQFSHRRSDQVATQVVEQVPAFYAPEDDFDAKGTSIKRHTANRGLATASYRSSSPAHPASVFQRRRWEKLPTDESRVGPGEYDDWDGKYHKTIARGVHDPWPAAQARRSPARRSATFASATGRSSGVLDGGPAHLNVTMGGGPRRTLRKVTDRLSSVTYGRLREAFDLFDAAGSGFLDYDRLLRALAHCGVQAGSNDMVRRTKIILDMHLEQTSNRLDFEGFAALAADLVGGITKLNGGLPAPATSPRVRRSRTSPREFGAVAPQVARTFHHFDANKSGFLGYRELRNALRHYGLSDATIRDAQSVVRRYDDTPDGRLDLNEFADLVRDLEAGFVRSDAVPPRIARTFYHFDANKSGFLGYRELRDALRHYGLSDATIRDAQSVVRRYDETPDGRLDLNEFAQLVRDLEAGVVRSDAVPPKVARTFYHFDANKSGFLGYRELRNALRHYGLSDATIRDAQSVVRRYDETPDGRLDLNEFAQLVRDLEAGVVRSDAVPPKVARTFYHFDANKSGFLGYRELRNALRHYGLSDATIRDAQSVVRRYDETPDGRLDLNEFAQLVRDLEAGVVRSDAVSPSPNPISPYSGRYTSPGAPEHRWARHMQRKLDEADDRWRLLSGVRSEMQAVRLEAQELTDHATMALSHIELKRREAEERALAAEKESADSQARIRDAERLAEFASAAWKNTEARLVAKEKQAATERKRLLQEAADLKRDAHRIISGRSSTSPFLRPPQIVTPLSEAPQYHSLSTFAEPSSVTRAFYHFDANKSGFLGYRELRDALRHYGLSDATIRDAQSVLRRYDDTPDGRLDLNEFAELVRDLEAGVIRSPVAPLGGVTAGWTPPDERSSASPLVPMPHGSPAVSSHVRQAFARFQQNGLISKPDLVAALSQYGLSITEEEVRAISIAYGEQSSGLNVYEFAALVSDVEFGLSSSLRAPGATSAKSKLYGASPPQQRPVQSLPRPSQPESQIAATQMRRPTATETKYPMNTQAVESSAVRAPMSSAPDWWQTRRWCLCFCPDVLPDSVVVRDLLRKDPL